MTSSNAYRLRASVVAVGRAALVVTGAVFVLTAVYARSADKRNLDWRRSLTLAVICGALWFCIMFASMLNKLNRDVPADEILSDSSLSAGKTRPQLSGFIAMQYYALILNRTFVVFTSPEGIYGWKVEGIVAAGRGASRYFEPYQQMLEDPAQLPSQEAVRKLSNLPGGFFISRSSITGVEFNPKPKWGMGGIPHSGRIEVKHISGRTAEFILLGKVDGEAIRYAILTGTV